MHRRGGGNKFRGGNRNFQNDRFHDDHDDRNSSWKPSEIKRVSFKSQDRNRKFVNNIKVRAILEDQEMVGELTQGGEGSQRLSGEFQRGKGSIRRNRKGSPVPRNYGRAGKLIQNPNGWYQIIIQHGAKYDRETMVKLLMSAMSPTAFTAHYYKIDVEARTANFYVDEFNVAEQIMRLDRKLELPDGFKIQLRVRSSTPQIRVDETLKERMKLAMVKRYNLASKAMDLTKFHADPDLSDIFCALFRPPIMAAIIDIISENIPDLEALNLNDNKIQMMDHMKVLTTKLPHLKILYLGNNRIFMLSSLDAVKGLPLVELFLDGNPCKTRIKDHAHYVSEIRKKFPKLVKLDGAEMGPTIGFDVDDSKQIPSWKSLFLCNQNGSDLVVKFLEQYFVLYDSDNRQQLLEAYHENAMLSITSTNNQHFTQEERLHAYWKFGRNLMHPKGYDYRFSSLKRGRLNAVSLLNELPPTKHDPQSFAVDLTLFTPQMIQLTVSGLFKERNADPKAEFTRTFQRTMIIVPNNGGFCIKNELMHINNASPQQAKNSFRAPVQTQPTMQAPVATVNQQVQVMPATIQSGPDDAIKQQMIQAIAQQTNMNAEWSRKCLVETSWDFTRAGFVFTELYKQNKIPPEAFTK